MKQNIEFNKKKHIWNGTASCILAAVECLIFLGLLVVSFLKEGNAGRWVGMCCVVIVLMALWGIYIGIDGVKVRKRVYKRACWAGIVLNVAVVAGMVWLFTFGL